MTPAWLILTSLPKPGVWAAISHDPHCEQPFWTFLCAFFEGVGLRYSGQLATIPTGGTVYVNAQGWFFLGLMKWVIAFVFALPVALLAIRDGVDLYQARKT